jgi:hypothetical protein
MIAAEALAETDVIANSRPRAGFVVAERSRFQATVRSVVGFEFMIAYLEDERVGVLDRGWGRESLVFQMLMAASQGPEKPGRHRKTKQLVIIVVGLWGLKLFEPQE